jgi:hypothetical protein
MEISVLVGLFALITFQGYSIRSHFFKVVPESLQ